MKTSMCFIWDLTTARTWQDRNLCQHSLFFLTELSITEIIVVVSQSMLFLLLLLHLYTDVDLYYNIDVVTGCHDQHLITGTLSLEHSTNNNILPCLFPLKTCNWH